MDLNLSEEQVVVFPNSMGISGEVHKKKSIKIDNAFGKISKATNQKNDED